MNASLRFLTGGIAGIVVAGLLVGPATAGPSTYAAPGAQTLTPPDRTSPAEALRVDRVPTPQLAWSTCDGEFECATVKLPLDYDEPHGKTVDIAVLRVRALDQEHKIGSLFLNPGGPGSSGVEFAKVAKWIFGTEVLNRFDIIGFDPRGIMNSTQVRCFATVEEQTETMTDVTALFPYGRDEENKYIAAFRKYGNACSTTGAPLSGAMSTAEVARDMDVLRRAVGDKKLTYLGFSYGTALGQYYANMFPDRVRAITIDGVVDPISWVGTRKTQDTLLDDRLRSGDGAYKAMMEYLARCDRAGTDLCALSGQAVSDFDLVTSRLKAGPALLNPDEVAAGGSPNYFSYADFIGASLGRMYDVGGLKWIIIMLSDLVKATSPGAGGTAADKAALRRLTALRDKLRAPQRAGNATYWNDRDANAGVLCTDALHPRDAALWPELTAQADRRAPHFARAWGWTSVICARSSWTVRDEDAYTGPFNRRTSAPVLVVGNYWDPATNYNGAVSSAALLPNSRLLSSDSWGHTAYGTSQCVTGAVDTYLLTGALPAKGTVCVGDVQPFSTSPASQRTAATARTERASAASAASHPSGEPKQLPPVVPLIPIPPLD